MEGVETSIDSPYHLCFDRSTSPVDPNSIIYIISAFGGLRRFDIKTSTCRSPLVCFLLCFVVVSLPCSCTLLCFCFCFYITGKLSTPEPLAQCYGIICTSAGILIVSGYLSCQLFAIRLTPTPGGDGHRGEVTDLLTGTAGDGDGGGDGSVQLSFPVGLALSDADHTLYIANRDSHNIVSVAIPDRFFKPVHITLQIRWKPTALDR